MLLLLHIDSNDINNQKEDKTNAEKLTENIINVGKSCINFSVKEAIISSTLTKNNTALTRLIQQANDILREQCVLNKFGFIFNDNRSRTTLWKDGTHLEDWGTDILAGNFDGFLNRFILSKSSEYSWIFVNNYIDEYFRCFCGNNCVQISNNSLSPKIVNDISNLGSVSSNRNSRSVKDYHKNSSVPKLVLKNLKPKNNHRLVILLVNLNINFISNKFDKLQLITQGKLDKLVITESKTDSTFPINQFSVQGYSKTYRFDRNRSRDGVFIQVREEIPSRELKIHNTTGDIESVFIQIHLF